MIELIVIVHEQTCRYLVGHNLIGWVNRIGGAIDIEHNRNHHFWEERPPWDGVSV